MIEVKDLLGKFENLLISEEFKRECVCRAISETTGIEINAQKIKIKKSVVYLDLKPLYKNEIFLKKELIQKKLTELLLDRNTLSEFR